MKRIFLLLVVLYVLLSLFFPSRVCFADSDSEELEKELEEQIEESVYGIDFSDFERYINSLDVNITDGKTLADMLISLTRGEETYSFSDILNYCANKLLGGFADFLPTLAAIVIIIVVFAIFFGSKSNFAKKQTGQIVYFACFSMVIVLTAKLVISSVSEVTKTLNGLTGVLNCLFPPLVTIMTALGGSLSSSLYKPQLAGFLALLSSVISKVIVPVFIAVVVFCIVGNISENIRLKKLEKLFRGGGEWLLKGLFSLFIGYITISGMVLGAVDGVSVKAAKFLVSSYVPIVGGYLSDGFDLVMASLVLIKNSLGVVGIIAIAYTVLAPVLKLVVLELGIKLISCLVEPIADKKISSYLYGVGDALRLLTVALLGVGFVFIVTVMLVIISTNSWAS